MNTLDMPRKKAGYSLDERCIDALKVLAERTGKSVNSYLEDLLFTHAKINQVIPPDAEPLGETRGGARPNTGRKSSKPDDESPIDNPTD